MKEAVIISSHGIGDCILGLSCASFLEKGDYKILVSARAEVFHALDHVFGDLFELERIDESISENNLILYDNLVKEKLWGQYRNEYKNLYYVVPDLLFNSPLAFPCQHYGVSPHVIKSTRLLLNQRRPKRLIYLGLNSTTEGYVYNNISGLAIELAKKMPDFDIILPLVAKWAGNQINRPTFSETLPNLRIQENPSILKSFDDIANASYFVGTDNGPSHLAYHYGIPRLILDPQFGRLPWIARWKEDYCESIPISTEVDDIVTLVNANVTIPQTTLIPRMEVLRRPFANWRQELFFKF